ncbi:Piso0_001240 [Millerozyma farinosa CBS 7064]|uniref:Piso0_001240 protein n=1 Tax=Pichia sorbitophila (strain ATCC MYA-4447 / BCRC 22081 / CBS 7064 / NBRC 10061 / NRRL Y-12695) TaxID=559304 RepID=G8YDU3_PICSO|nr:Piso0_001240 [Millerozyma farinosa CBS 7064]
MSNETSVSQIAALAAFKNLGNKQDKDENHSPKGVSKNEEPKTRPPYAAPTHIGAANKAKQRASSTSKVPQLKTKNLGGFSEGSTNYTPTTPKYTPSTPKYKPATPKNVSVTPKSGAGKVSSTNGRITPNRTMTAPDTSHSFSYYYDSSDNDYSSGGDRAAPRRVSKSSSHQSELSIAGQPLSTVRESRSQCDPRNAAGDQSSHETRKSISIPSASMIEHVKSSINSKARTEASAKERVQKAKDTISGLRESIESKKVFTRHAGSVPSLAAVEDSNNPGDHSLFFYERLGNVSNTSLGSSISGSQNSVANTPAIVVNGREKRNDTYPSHESLEEIESDDYSDCDLRNGTKNALYNEALTKNISGKSSSDAGDNLEVHSSDGRAGSPRDTSVLVKSKLKRKPPPIASDEFKLVPHNSYTYEGDYSDSSNFSRDRNISGKSDDLTNNIKDQRLNRELSASDAENKGEETLKLQHADDIIKQDLPRFPELGSDRRRSDAKRHLFKGKLTKTPNESSLSFFDMNSEAETGSDFGPDYKRPGEVPLNHRLGGSSQQPIHLKTTMREKSRKKEKKLAFNENKPWKNHNDLSYITEAERKRYEGLFASNRGLYINCVITKLRGVSYGAKSDEKQKSEAAEASSTAAKLSSQANKDTQNNDFEAFHNWNSVDIDQLIHGVVVKRIWVRSKLPLDTLEAIWNLVDFRNDGTLNKPEFIVGMWLVDQCLYGRKLPKKVESSVWDSLGNIGLNVVIKKKGKR